MSVTDTRPAEGLDLHVLAAQALEIIQGLNENQRDILFYVVSGYNHTAIAHEIRHSIQDTHDQIVRLLNKFQFLKAFPTETRDTVIAESFRLLEVEERKNPLKAAPEVQKPVSAPVVPAPVPAPILTAPPNAPASTDEEHRANLALLSPYQRRILTLMAEGASNITIAQALNTSPEAIGVQNSKMYSRLCISRTLGRSGMRNAAVELYRKFGLQETSLRAGASATLPKPAESAAAPNPFYRDIGKRLYERRRRLGMSYEQVATILRISAEDVKAYERGNKPLSLVRFVLYTKALKIEAAELLKGFEYEPQGRGEAIEQMEGLLTQALETVRRMQK